MSKILICISIFIFHSVCQAQTTAFTDYTDWNTVKTTARTENKQILLYFGAPWCLPCKQLLKGVFADGATQAYLRSKFLCYAFDFDQDNAVIFLKKYAITAIPLILILNQQGYLKASLQSIPQDIPTFKDEIKKIADSDFAYQSISNDLDLKYPQFYNDFFASKQKTIPDSSAVTNYLKSQTDLFSEINWNVLNLFNTDDEFFDFILSNKEKYIEQYGHLNVGLKLYHIYTLFFEKYTATKDSVGFNKVIRKYIKNEGDPNYKSSLKSYYMREIRFLAVTGLDWNKFITKAREYIQTYGESENSFICSYAFDAPSRDDSLNLFLLQSMKPVLTQTPSVSSYLMYATLLLKLGRSTEAEAYFKRVLAAKVGPESQSLYKDKVDHIKKEFGGPQ